MSQLKSLANKIGDPSEFPTGVRSRGLGERFTDILPFAISQFGDPQQVNPILQQLQITPEEEFEQQQQIASLRQDLLKDKLNALLGVEQINLAKETSQLGQRKFEQQQLKNIEASINEQKRLANEDTRINISQRKLDISERKEKRTIEKAEITEAARNQVAQVRLESGDIEGYYRTLAGAPLAPVGGSKSATTRLKAIEQFRDNDKLIVQAGLQLDWPEEILNQMAETRVRIDEETDGVLRDLSARVWEAYWGTRVSVGGDPKLSVNVDGFTLKGRILQEQFITDITEKLSFINLDQLEPMDKQVLLQSIAEHTPKFSIEEIERILKGIETQTQPSLTSQAIGSGFENLALQVATNPTVQRISQGIKTVGEFPGKQVQTADLIISSLLSNLFAPKEKSNVDKGNR